MSGNGKHTEFFIELSQALGDMPAGYRGSREFSDIGLYELHEEVPIDGIGVPFDYLLAVERTPDGRETKTPYREYFTTGGREARCIFCDRNTVTTSSCRAARRDPKRWEAAGRAWPRPRGYGRS